MTLARFAAAVVYSSICSASVLAGQYHVAPGPNTVVDLAPADFLKYAPEGANYDPSSAVGDDYGQHPGAFITGGPPPGSYFVGVFANAVNLQQPDGELYLWETTSIGWNGEEGPLIQLGLWDWNLWTFTPLGDELSASYYGTQFPSPQDPFYEINSSVTRLSDFHVPGHYVNAVRVSYNRLGHNQVTAVASNAVVPEPGTLALCSAGIAGLVLRGWYRRSMRRRA